MFLDQDTDVVRILNEARNKNPEKSSSNVS